MSSDAAPDGRSHPIPLLLRRPLQRRRIQTGVFGVYICNGRQALDGNTRGR